MDLNKIRYFHEVYRNKGLNGAQEALNISKPAISTSLRLLEESLGVQLFTRTKNSMLPTADADTLYQNTSALFSDVESICEKIRNGKDEFSGNIRIGAPICFGSEMLRPFINQFIKEFDKINIDLKLSEGSQIANLLDQGLLDFAIIGDDFASKIPKHIHTKKVFDYELKMVCSKQYFQKHFDNEKLNFANLKEHRYVLLSHIGLDSWLQLHFNKGFNPSKNYYLNNHHAHIESLISSQGIGLQASYSIQNLLDKGKLVELKPTNKKLIYSFYATQFYDQVPTRILKQFINDFEKYLTAKVH